MFGSYEKLLMYAAANVSAAFDGGVDAIWMTSSHDTRRLTNNRQCGVVVVTKKKTKKIKSNDENKNSQPKTLSFRAVLVLH